MVKTEAQQRNKKMKPRRKHIIVKSYDEQKEIHQVKCPDGRVINLYIGRRYNENGREMSPVVCEVLEVGEGVTNISKGDVLITHHNLLTNEALTIERNLEEQYTILSVVNDNTLYAKILPDGKLVPVNGNCIANRIKKNVNTSLEVPFELTEEMLFDIVSVSDDIDFIKKGDRVLCHKYSDYEMVYHFNNEEKRAIRIWKDDILGIVNNY
jgi:hypothetical protein